MNDRTWEDSAARDWPVAGTSAADGRFLREILDASADSTMCLDRAMRVVFVNRRLIDIAGIPFEDFIGRTHRELGYPEDLVRIWEGHNQEVFDTGNAVTYEFEIVNDGHREWYETRVAPVVDRAGNVVQVIATSRDVTARRMTEGSLRTSQELLQRAQRIAQVGTWHLDAQTDAVTWTRELAVMMGLDPDQPAPDLSAQERLFTPQSWTALTEAITRALTDGIPYEVELQVIRPDGRCGWMLARGEAVTDQDGTIVAVQGVALDITERKTTLDRLQTMATHDALTGLPNRVGLLAEIERGLSADRRTGRSTAVLMMDLDHFKDINDVMGHSAGDELLVAIAQRLQSTVRGSDLVARLGGDEFVAVLRGLPAPHDAMQAATRLAAAFDRPIQVNGTEVQVTVSIGVAIATPADDAEGLVRDADTAMYTAKAEGRDRISVFNEEQRAVIAARLDLEAQLRRAVDHHEFAVWYQPEVDLLTGEVVGAEALLRWSHPDGEVRPAEQFIDALENCGLLLRVGPEVLRAACSDGVRWAAARPDRAVVVRVNISASELNDNGLLGVIDDALQSSGMDPRLLCLEFRESALLAQNPTTRSNLSGLHHRGIALSIDNFGTGTASLTNLQRHPIDRVQIHRSYLLSPEEGDHDHRLIQGIIILAGILGIDVTAEGVEHSVQAAHLRDLGCPTGSGWLFAPALPAADLERAIQSRYDVG